VRPEHHTEPLATSRPLNPDELGYVQGYNGLYNFKHHFWVVEGSRLYPPIPQIWLNISQNLAADFGQFFYEWPHYRLLLKLIDEPSNVTSDRVLTAMKWFNEANSFVSGEESAIVCLAIAFETLLDLPEGKGITERFTDTVSLLLGRIPRLDIWARQFYDTRSEIVHEGRASKLRFIIDESKKTTDVHQYGSLLPYGQQVFQLCVATLLFGAGLAERAGLQEKLVTNQERFTQICLVLDDRSIVPIERLQRVVQLAGALERFKFVWESSLKVETRLGCARLAAETLLECNESLDPSFRSELERLAKGERTDHYEALDAVRALHDISALSRPSMDGNGPIAVTLRLMDVIWGYSFWNYFAEKERREKEQELKPGGLTESSP